MHPGKGNIDVAQVRNVSFWRVVWGGDDDVFVEVS